ncbi:MULTISPECIES: N-acetylmuramic acid 6-phosphate etherase [unclassified Lentimonas]|uniref:N-acetylmuramic acid 6-phosphate etherase n=1 Tax=unclassified Lentimonas TaxID=2630993 RepID=UPI001328B64B|nr:MULTISPECIES: N-acetylmuramic acid 6-phosphate etherase [unclassified Lentimonas]CAA6690159.1 N-acetylmuramic acid 6-phosphate etherase [Lentimonas sp. CC10]CAA6696007.1 N-acetylmuramic acid 6-phosphate etherase [Lentimonas sp. CC19]CAA7070210.1 N-acetylmuramic acid 6-phosphate etherase [Lentimonas sp. CC11]
MDDTQGAEKIEENLGGLGTESRDLTLRGLDAMDSLTIVNLIADTNEQAVAAVRAEAASIAAAIEAVSARLGAGGRLFYVGAGTSGRLGVLDASECPPTFGVSPDMIQGVIAGGEGALVRSVEGAEDDASQGAEALRARGVTSGDAVMAIAASGRTPYCIGALQEARSVGALTVALSCNKNAALSEFADQPIEVATGAEVIAGSTRMKAGTAQKIVLNMMTTTAMVRIGKVYEGQMVDMAASNEKLRARACRIVMQTTDLATEAEAEQLLQQAGGNMKTAIVMARASVSREVAERLLEAAGGNVRDALTGSID